MAGIIRYASKGSEVVMSFFKSRRQKLVDIYKKLQGEDSLENDAENILQKYPKLELVEVLVISAYLDRDEQPGEFDRALKKLGVK